MPSGASAFAPRDGRPWRVLDFGSSKDAVVLIEGDAFGDARDEVQNPPTEAHPDVILLRGGIDDACVRSAFSDRKIYRIVSAGDADARIEPLP